MRESLTLVLVQTHAAFTRRYKSRVLYCLSTNRYKKSELMLMRRATAST